MASEVLAEIIRSGFLEGVHRGSVVTLDAAGVVDLRLGNPDAPMYPRSSSKLAQAAAMLRAGLDLDGELLALASASHSGEAMHLDGVRRILASAGLDTSALQTPPDFPLDDDARAAALRAGAVADPVFMNCSGKHAAMLATCVVNGWPTASYRDVNHPLQIAMRESVERLSGEPVAHTGTDGCGAPLFAFSLTGLARMFRALAMADTDSAEGRVVAAARAHPEWLSGTRREEARVMRAVPGLVHKAGAEAVQAGALPDGRAYAVKVDDGYPRARPVVAAAALRRLGVASPVNDESGRVVLLGAGLPVGEVRAAF